MAYKAPAIKGKMVNTLKFPISGLSTIKTPMEPSTTHKILRNPTLVLKNRTENPRIKMGELNKAAPASAIGIRASEPKYKIMDEAINTERMKTIPGLCGQRLCPL